ncbi:DUF692 domain-containing protein [Streptomyces varsoviensis]|uniref:DUF692 domain-containing protein n=1 Tax=Streptomyces varsoviensis TaxID=67373 RepID=UPI0033DFB27C
MRRLGVGMGWRPEIAEEIGRLPGVDWVEVVSENICPVALPEALRVLRERGTAVVPHGVSLGLGGAERPDAGRLAALAERAEALGAPLVTEHIAFVRAGGLEAGHLLPVPRTRDALDVLCENVRIAQDALPVPLALENIAALVNWPDEEMPEGRFLAELVDRTGVRLLIDVANLHTNHVNRGEDPCAVLDELPLEAIAYVHVAGGIERDGVWHDTHAHPVTPPILDLLAELRSRTAPPGVLLERDDNFPAGGELAAELEEIRAVFATPRVRTGPGPLGVRTGSGTSGVRTGPGASGVRTNPDAPAPRTAARRPYASQPQRQPAPGHGIGTARRRLAAAQSGLLSALVAGAPVPAGFDGTRLRVQAEALAAKRAAVVAKVAPELPGVLGDGYRPAFLRYARTRPLTGGFRRDALSFVEHLLASKDETEPRDRAARRELTRWWRQRSGPAPLPAGRTARLAEQLARRLRRQQPGHAPRRRPGSRRRRAAGRNASRAD